MGNNPRFARLRTDPRFRKPKKQSSKVVLDERFKSLLSNEGDNQQSSSRRRVDKYGRKTSASLDADNLRRFYRFNDDDSLKNAAGPDLARGEVLLESSDESASDAADSDAQDDDSEVVLGSHLSKPISVPGFEDDEYAAVDLNEDDSVYADLDAQAEVAIREQESDDQQEDAEHTNRLAVVNLDWDHVRASHLYKIFSSLLSPTGATSNSRSKIRTARGNILSVRVYISEFGKARLKKEEVEGPPKEIFKKARRNPDALLEEDEGDECDEEALRKYQLDRLRYYYAIVTFDTVVAAEFIHAELNGTELERSANVFDISFVPNDMTFDEEFREEATPETNMGVIDYKGLDFSTDALRHSKVKLHWDEDDPERNKITRRTLTLKEIEEDNFKALIASSSESSDDEMPKQSGKNRDKLRALLLDDDDDLPEGWSNDAFNESKGRDGDVEITFTPGLSENKVDPENETTLAKYKRKMKEKRAQRKQEKTKADSQAHENKRDNNVIGDDFFGEDDGESGIGSEHDTLQPSQTEALLENAPVLSGSSGETKELKHFSLKAILKSEKRTKGSKKKSGKKRDTRTDEDELQEDFQINVNDDRFKALHDDHTFAIDPSNPHFTKTKGMAALLDERAKRQRSDNENSGRLQKSLPKSTSGQNLQNLVESVKRKSQAAYSQKGGKRQRV